MNTSRERTSLNAFTGRRTHVLIGLGLAVLFASTIVVGYGNYLKGNRSAAGHA